MGEIAEKVKKEEKENPEERQEEIRREEPKKEEKMRRIELRTTLMYAVIGAIIGYVSFLIDRPGFAILLMVAVLYIAYITIKTIMGIDEKIKWWLANGMVIYILMWLVVWTIYYNLRLFG